MDVFQGNPSLTEVDDALKPFLDGLSHAVTHRCLVVIHTLWQPVRFAALLPFHLHLRWPGLIDALPLTVTCAFVPFLNADAYQVGLPLYSPQEANLARRRARAYRNTANTSFSGDFVHPDWEEGFARHRPHWQDRLLPGCSFLAVNAVGQTGHIARGSRPHLGAIAVRKAPHPHILVPAHGPLSAEAYSALAHADLLLVNLQKVRGRHALTVIREVLIARGANQPSLLIASSPSDLFALSWNELDLDATDYLSGHAPAVQAVRVTMVGLDRPQAERTFEVAVAELRGSSPLAETLATFATAAWWSSRQSIAQESGETDASFRRFHAALERASMEAPAEARLFTAADTLITDTFRNCELAQERLNAVIEAVFSSPAGESILVLAKHSLAAAHIQVAIAVSGGVTPPEVEASGIICCDLSSAAATRICACAISCGYFGSTTIDAILASGASTVHMILDPIEARIAWYDARAMARQMRQAGSLEAERTLLSFCSALSSYLLPFSDVLSLSLDHTIPGPSLPPPLPRTSSSGSGDEEERAIILSVDGTWLEVSRTMRLEIIDRQGMVRLRTLLPAELQAGDEMLVVASDAHALFSEHLMQTLDTGSLRPLAEKRATWLMLLGAVMAGTRPNLRAVHRNLNERGIQVGYQTVLAWARPSTDNDQTTPQRWQHFKAFAEALGMTLPEAYLAELFQAIRLWRTRHRLAGRNLVRAMRGAYLGRLDSTILARIEREWGLDARKLIQSTRLVEVDSVML